MPLTTEQLQDAYRQMLVIRKFEEMIRDLYQQGKIRGSFHPCVGQEATAVGGCWALRTGDYMTCTYRGHGQAIAKGLSVRAAMAEMLGKASGCSKGKGGSMHFTDPAVDCSAPTRSWPPGFLTPQGRRSRRNCKRKIRLRWLSLVKARSIRACSWKVLILL